MALKPVLSSRHAVQSSLCRLHIFSVKLGVTLLQNESSCVTGKYLNCVDSKYARTSKLCQRRALTQNMKTSLVCFHTTSADRRLTQTHLVQVIIQDILTREHRGGQGAYASMHICYALIVLSNVFMNLAKPFSGELSNRALACLYLVSSCSRFLPKLLISHTQSGRDFSPSRQQEILNTVLPNLPYQMQPQFLPAYLLFHCP